MKERKLTPTCSLIDNRFLRFNNSASVFGNAQKNAYDTVRAMGYSYGENLEPFADKGTVEFVYIDLHTGWNAEKLYPREGLSRLFIFNYENSQPAYQTERQLLLALALAWEDTNNERGRDYSWGKAFQTLPPPEGFRHDDDYNKHEQMWCEELCVNELRTGRFLFHLHPYDDAPYGFIETNTPLVKWQTFGYDDDNDQEILVSLSKARKALIADFEKEIAR